MAALSRREPGYGAIVLSFPDPPAIALDVRVGGGLEVNRVPWLRKAVSDATWSWIKEEMLWPQRMLISARRRRPRRRRAGERADGRRTERAAEERPLLRAETNLMSLKELATGEIGTKSGGPRANGDFADPGDDAAAGAAANDDLASADASMDDGPIVDVEITDPDNPRPAAPPGPTAREVILGWLGGAAKATADKTLEVSKATIETSRKVATSDDTKRVLATVARTPKNVGSWWERDARSWMNNVRGARHGGTAADKRGTRRRRCGPIRREVATRAARRSPTRTRARRVRKTTRRAPRTARRRLGGGRGHRALAAGKEEAGDVDEAFGFCLLSNRSKRSRPRLASRKFSLHLTKTRRTRTRVRVRNTPTRVVIRHLWTRRESRASRVSTHPSSFADEAMMGRSRDPSPRSCGAPPGNARGSRTRRDASRSFPSAPGNARSRRARRRFATRNSRSVGPFRTPLAAG